MNIPLKGGMLQEFIQQLKLSGDLKSLGICEDSEAAKYPSLKMTMDIVQRITDLVIEKVDNKGAAMYGVDARDMMNIIARATGHKAPDDSTEHSNYIAISRDDNNPENIKVTVSEAETNITVIQQVMQLFSMCLAVQEGKQKELLDLVERDYQSSIRIVNASAINAEDKVLEMSAKTGAIAGSLLTAEHTLNALKARKSPIAGLVEQSLFGIDYTRTKKKAGISELLDHAIEVFAAQIPEAGNFDGSTEQGRQNIRKYRTFLIKGLQEHMGMQSREID